MPPPRRTSNQAESSSLKRSIKAGRLTWHAEIQNGIDTGNWNLVREQITLFKSYRETIDPAELNKKKFWRRLSNQKEEKDHTGLRAQDKEGRTPLQLALTTNETPNDIIMEILHIEPKAATLVNERKRLPLHFAVVHRHPIEIIGELIEVYPGALPATDIKGKSPLTYAMEMAKRKTNVRLGPRTFWMPAQDGTEEAEWQEEQGEKWGVVHWLLLSSATHPQISLSVGGLKPMLVDALLHAAPPAVISLLIGASSMLLSFDNRATAFAGSTLYSSITRHYPITILMSLASQCPADVRLVRDETGMGLVSALFISGCFEPIKNTGEWTVSESFYSAMEYCMDEGVLYDADEAFVDWWKKIEFLVAYCGGEKANEVIKDRLLHAALINSDVPPVIVRMLLSLYPKSISFLDPVHQVYPVHLAAATREYIPRQYESQCMGSESMLQIVVKADTSTANKRHQRRLPLNVAIESGKTYEALEQLVLANPKALKCRDLPTKLYPFQQAASYANKGDEDSFRWSCVARNKFSHAVWKGLSDRQRAAAVYRVVEEESLNRLGTIYELLRREPGVVKPSKPKKAPVCMARDSSGMGMVAAHYMTWCYKSEKEEWIVNEANMAALKFTIQEASRTSKMENAPPDFIKWWGKLKFWIRYCCPTRFERDDEVFVLPSGDEYLLHAALMNSDTPPHVIELLVALNASSISTPMPGNTKLPLHIAAQAVPYTARPFELIRTTCLELTARAYPQALRVMSEGKLPLHVAINAGKTWGELEPIVHAEPRALKVPESTTGLYPFQSMAIRQTYTTDQRLRFQYIARNSVDAAQSKRQSAQDFSYEVRKVQKAYQLDVLGSVYELLRQDASVVRREKPSPVEASVVLVEETDPGDITVGPRGDFEPAIAESLVSTAAESVDAESQDADDEYSAPNSLPPTSLVRLLSRSDSKSDDEERDLFECDTSALSNADIMSTLSSSFDLASQSDKSSQRKTFLAGLATSAHRKQDAQSLHSTANKSLGLEDETSRHPEFGEDSDFPDETSRHPEFGEDSGSLIEASRNTAAPEKKARRVVNAAETADADGDADNTEHSSESVVVFQLRRKPRNEHRKDQSKKAPSSRPKPQSKTVSSISAEQSVQSSAFSAQSDSNPSLAPVALLVGAGAIGATAKAQPATHTRDALPSDSESGASGVVSLAGPTEHQQAYMNSSLDMVWIDEDGDNNQDSFAADDNDAPITVDNSSSLAGVAPRGDDSEISAEEALLEIGGASISTVPNTPPPPPLGKSAHEIPAAGNVSASAQNEHSTPASEKRFDKRSMSWKSPKKSEREVERKPAEEKGPAKLQMYFDKKTMRWKAGQAPAATTEDFYTSNTSFTGSETYPYYQPVKEKLQSPPHKKTSYKPPDQFVASNPEDVLAVSEGSGRETAFRSQNTLGRTLSDRHKNSKWYAILSKDRELTCLLCDENNREVMLLPCRHLCICKHCSVKEKKLKSCPTCSGSVTERMLIF